MKRFWIFCTLSVLAMLVACQPTVTTNAQETQIKQASKDIFDNVLPTLISVTAPQDQGDRLVLQGRYFGDGFAGGLEQSYIILAADSQGEGGFLVNPNPNDWTPNRITLDLPEGVGYGHVFVVVNGVFSNGLPANLGRNLPINPMASSKKETNDDTEVEVEELFALLPGDMTMYTNQVQSFTVTGVGEGDNIVWSTSGGQLEPVGKDATYISPQTPGTYTVSINHEGQELTTMITVVRKINVDISPSEVTLSAGEVQTFRALIEGADASDVVWTAPNGGTIEGTTDNSGAVRFVAPAVIGQYSLVVASQSNPTQTATATINVREVEVDISPGSVILPIGTNEDFTAIVSNALENTVTWQATGGNLETLVGQPNTVRYTPPNLMGQYTITATSTRDISKFATATINVIEPSLVINPSRVLLNIGEGQQFSVVFNDTVDTNVLWEVPDGGTVQGTGNTITFVPPTVSGNYRIIARSTFDASKSAVATVTVRGSDGSSAPVGNGQVVTTIQQSPQQTSQRNVQAQVSSIKVNPEQASLVAGEARTFEAIVNAGTQITWEAPDGGELRGNSSIVTFIAPNTSGVYRLIAQNVADYNDRYTVNITVGNPIEVSILPPAAQLRVGQSQQFGAVVVGTDNSSVLWDIPDGGDIAESEKNTVIFIAPVQTGTYRLIAQSFEDPSKFAEIFINVIP